MQLMVSIEEDEIQEDNLIFNVKFAPMKKKRISSYSHGACWIEGEIWGLQPVKSLNVTI